VPSGRSRRWKKSGSISREAGIALKAQAVLFRASHQSANLEIELTRRNIPFVKFGGLKFSEATHIKDVLSFRRWAQNMRDRVVGCRVAQLLPGIGPSAAARLLERIAEVSDPMRALGEFKPPAATAEHWQDFEATVSTPSRNAVGWPGAEPGRRKRLVRYCRGYLRPSAFVVPLNWP
jgi:DNA helicase-2/ATP-dependent DNA helicase PcrA